MLTLELAKQKFSQSSTQKKNFVTSMVDIDDFAFLLEFLQRLKNFKVDSMKC